MGKTNKRMWGFFINQIPAPRLETFTWWFGVSAIILPIMGGVCGWIAFEMSDRVSRNKEAEMTSRIAQAEAAARPKPYPDRLFSFLSSLDSQIPSGLATNSVQWTGLLRPDQNAMYEALLNESGAEKYIRRELYKEASLRVTNDGTLMHGVTFVVQQKLFTEIKKP